MAGELQTKYTTGQTVYFVVLNPTGNTVWNGSTFASISGATWTACKIAATEQGTTGIYTADMPSGITTQARYGVLAYQQLGGSAANTDTLIGSGTQDWPVIASLITSNVRKNQAISAFGFVMTDSTNHAPASGLTVTATRSIDGGAFSSCANAVSGIASGAYKIDLAASDLNGNVIILRFTATGADDLLVTLVTQP